MAGPNYTLITGASQGLGKYLALYAAQRGWNLVLVALPKSGLQQLAAYITKQYLCNVIVFEKDLSDQQSCMELYYALKQEGIGINRLINNAGMGGHFAFDEKDASFFMRQIAINTTAPTLLTRLFLDDLKKNAPSQILNVGSLVSFFNLPNKQVYSGTKSFLLSFSNSLRRELEEEDISVSVVCPGGMDTRWQLMMEHRLERPWLFRQSVLHPSVVARQALEGMLQKKAVIIPGRLNRVFLLLDRLLPRRLTLYLTRLQLKGLKPIVTQPADAAPVTESIAV